MNSVYKIVVLGQGRVGKTSISVKYVKNQFNDSQQKTINASYLQKKVTLQNNKHVKLSIWDTAGQEEFNSVAPIYYRDAVGAIVVYQITSRESFDKVKKWVAQLEQNAPKDIVLTIVGNKADLQSSRIVENSEVQKFSKQHKATHFVVSAKNGFHISDMFNDLAERISQVLQVKNIAGKRITPRITVEMENSKKQSNDKKKCC